MDLRYNATCDSAYILLEHGHIVSTRRLPGMRRMVDYDGLGRPVGVILHKVRQGVDLEGLPFADEIAALLRGSGIPVNRGGDGPPRPVKVQSVRRTPARSDRAAGFCLNQHRHESAA